MYKKIIKLTLALSLMIPISANAWWGKKTVNKYIVDPVVDYVKGEVDQHIVEPIQEKLEEVCSNMQIDIGQMNFPELSEDESVVLSNYINAKDLSYCTDLDKTTSHVMFIKETLDPYENNKTSLAKFTLADGITPAYTSTQNADNVVDAFRHSRVTALVSAVMGNDSTDNFGLQQMNAHERKEGEESSYSNQYNTNTEFARYMDLHNNNVGYKLYLKLKDKYTFGDMPTSLPQAYKDEVESELLSRCYSYIEVIDPDDTNGTLLTDFKDKVDSMPGLVYFKDYGIKYDENGNNCAVPKISSLVNYYEKNQDLTLYATGSIEPINGTIKQYRWKFENPILYCTSYCKSTTEIITTNPHNFGSYSRIIWKKYNSRWFSYRYPVMRIYKSRVYLLNTAQISVELEVSNQFDVYSRKATMELNK